jgi:uncharacterized protein (DUF885 family)
VGDSRSVEEIEEAIKKQMVADFAALQKLTSENPGLITAQTSDDSSADTQGTDTNGSSTDSLETDTAESSLHSQETGSSGSSADSQNSSTSTVSPAALLAELRQKITTDFPVLPSVSCEVKYVHPSLQEYLSPAFYLTPAIDDYENNVIYINPSSDYDGLELFTTLAHEGYPGHLYQSVYFSSQEPDLLRNLLDVGGYTEGWATYVEMYAYDLWEEDPTYAAICQKNRSFTLGLASLLDIGIHLHGYTPEQVSAFLEKLGFSSDTAQSLYNNILQSPANYLQYYVGYLDFCELRDTAKAQQENFSLREFHRFVLETGPAPFDILNKYLYSSFSDSNS